MMSDETVVGIVVASRFLIPLVILRYPLPGILGAILADGDRVILHAYTDVPLDDYQVYDKAFDVYYLSIAYVSTLRNWHDPTAITIGRLLWLYRLFGVALFALVDDHRLLFLFPAAFEFFFVLYEVFRARWAPERLAGAALLMMAAVAWTLKLPQEYWLHVARRGTTAWLERNILHPDPSVRDMLVAATAVFSVGVAFGGVRLALRHLPAADHPWRFKASVMTFGAGHLADQSQVRTARSSRTGLVEKLALVTLLGMMFAEFAPGLDESTVQVGLGLAFLVVGNAVLSVRFAKPGDERRTAARDVAAACALNAPILASLIVGAQWVNVSVATGSSVFLVLLASLLIGLHNRYHETYRQLVAQSRRPRDS